MADEAEAELLTGVINPLHWIEALLQKPSDITHESILRFLCGMKTDRTISGFLIRYNEITAKHQQVDFIPVVGHFIGKLIDPLRHANACFLIESFLGTITLCGTVAEMLTILRFEIDQHQKGNVLDEAGQKKLFGRTFEKLVQERRVEVLQALGLVSEELKGKLTLIRETRNNYLHLWSTPVKQARVDAVLIYALTVDVLVETLGIKIQNNCFELPTAVLNYLKSQST